MEQALTDRFEALLAAVGEPNAACARAARDRWNAVAKPIGSLGELELMVESIAALCEDADVVLDKRVVVVLCADNGVVARGVSQCGPEVTTVIADSIANNRSSVCKMAGTVRADAIAVDMGMATPASSPAVWDCHIARGTHDISVGPAMSKEQAMCAIVEGVRIVERLKDEGYKIIATGEMGIANTTTSSAMAAAFTGMPPEAVTGRGAGLSDEGLKRKVNVVSQALEANAVDADDALDVLSKLGGFDIAGMVGMFIGAALHRVPIVVDGFISVVAAVAATRLCPACAGALLFSHVSAEPAARVLLAELGARPVIDARMRLGEGTGAVCLLPLLDAALALYNGTTFKASGIEAYEVNP